MTAPARRLVLAGAACAALAAVPAARAAGPPLPSSDSGRAGAVAPGGAERLLTRRAGAATAVVAVRGRDGRVLRSRRIRGRWSVPAVTLDNATTGLSADGRTLVLARPARRFPPTATHLAVLDARRLRIRRRVALRGFFTVDAISPDGGRVYLVQYGGDVLDYRVRVLDTGTGRLAAGDVVDPRSPGEQMGGLPLTRAVSRDGRWAYTLYGGGAETFVHALDTVGATAACVDLDALPPQTDLSGARLRLRDGGRHLEVLDRGRLVSTVDARTFEVSRPRPAASAPPPTETSAFPWAVPWLLAGAAGLSAAALFAARVRPPGRASRPRAPRR